MRRRDWRGTQEPRTNLSKSDPVRVTKMRVMGMQRVSESTPSKSEPIAPLGGRVERTMRKRIRPVYAAVATVGILVGAVGSWSVEAFAGSTSGPAFTVTPHDFRRRLCHTEKQSRHVDIESVVPWAPSGHSDRDVGDTLAGDSKVLVRLPGGCQKDGAQWSRFLLSGSALHVVLLCRLTSCARRPVRPSRRRLGVEHARTVARRRCAGTAV